MKRLLVTATTVLLLGAQQPVSAQGLPTEKVLPLALAEEIAAEAVAACAKGGFKVTAAVVDRAGLTRVILRGDGAAPHTLDTSTRKAYTAASMRTSTTALMERVAANPASANLKDINKVLLLGGGLPIKAGDEVVGGVGVGGAPGGDKDDVCAQAGLDKVKDRLK